MPVIPVYTGYYPRAAFLRFHDRLQRWAVMICHRRAGKTVAAIWDLIEKALAFVIPAGFDGPGRFAFMAPSRVRAKEIAWDYLKRFAGKIPGIKTNESELYVEFPNGARVTLYGAENERGMGLYLDGIVYDECDDIPPSVDAVVEPSLSDRRGWTVHMGILRGRHNLFDRHEKLKNRPEYFTMYLRASESGIMPQEELDRLKQDAPIGIGEAAYQLQYELDASASIANAIYGKEMDALRRDNRLRPINADPGAPLFTFWDIGHSDQADHWACWLVQFQGRDIVLLNYLARTGQIPAWYAAKMREWEDRYQKRIQMHYLPHDAKNRNAVGKTHLDYLREAGMDRLAVVDRTPNLWDSIHHLQRLFPRIFINSPECDKYWMLGERKMPSGVDCLDFYRKKEEAVSGIIRDVPVHDDYGHGADGLRTLSEASRLGMIEGTSDTAEEGRAENRGPRVILAGYNQQPLRRWQKTRVLKM
jgi:hypothetical protein